jgi:hypothetical protein
MSARPASRIGRVLRTIAWALFIAFITGFLIGNWIRSELEEPVRYIGDRDRPALSPALSPVLSPAPTLAHLKHV